MTVSPLWKDASSPNIPFNPDDVLPRLRTFQKDETECWMKLIFVNVWKGQKNLVFRSISPEGLCKFQFLPFDVNLINNDERYHEDPGIVDLAVTFCDQNAEAAWPEDIDSVDEMIANSEEEDGTFQLLWKTSRQSTLCLPNDTPRNV